MESIESSTDMSDPPNAIGQSSAEPRAWVVCELLGIFLLCFLFAGSSAPSTNEPHYLGKAKHYWNPSWCAGDFFLESGDAHAVFYWTYGWVTQFISLEQASWLGRAIVWMLFALSWRSLASSVTNVRWGGLLSAFLLLPLIHFGHLSGEWLIGGVEAKGFAWPLVFWGLACACRAKWWLVWPLFGLASSFHILVGGWAVIAGLIGWWLRRKEDELQWSQLGIWLCVGGVLALPGLVPALQLTAQASPEEMREASITYSFRRLSHHLVFYRFARWNMVRFGYMVLGWWVLSKSVPQSPGVRRLHAIVLGSLAIAMTGIALDMILGPISQSLRASLLRYYWFRASDILVPTGVSMALVCAARLPRRRFETRTLAVAIVIAAIGIGVAMGTVGFGARSMALAQQNWQNFGDAADVEAIDQAWKDVCRWIQHPDHVPAETVFLTPTRQQTFKWYAHRPDVVTWKDVPQDAKALNAWWQRRLNVHRLGDWPWTNPDEFVNIVELYGVTHVVWPDPGNRFIPNGVTQIYRNELFRVFQLTP